MYYCSMTTTTSKKLKQLLTLFDTRKILFSQELQRQGFSSDLLQWYRKAGWIESFARGAYKKTNIDISLEDLISAFQNQLDINIHFGGKYCLSKYYGINHFISYSEQKANLFLNESKHKIPSWFAEMYKNQVKLIRSDFVDSNIGLSKGKNEIIIASPELAFIELLYLVPEETSVTESKEILELLPNLRPKTLQALLEDCKSIKVKRLFFYLSEKVNHSWFKYLKIDNIDLGKGVREIEKHGKFIEKYQIVVKEEEI